MSNTHTDLAPHQPLILDPTQAADAAELATLRSTPGIREYNTLPEQLEEYHHIMNPSGVIAEISEPGTRVVYYPWRNTLVHTLPPTAYRAVRSSRNRHLIREEEQRVCEEQRVAIIGLSVGSSIAQALALEGVTTHFTLVDGDTLSLSNLNRIPAGITELGLPKTALTMQRLFEYDPYLTITSHPALTVEHLHAVLQQSDILIDEIDDLAMKYALRTYAQQYRKPIIMATDNGEESIVDIERYDLDPSTTPFNGRMPALSAKELQQLSKPEAGKIIAEFIGHEHVSARMYESLADIGKILTTWPQLGGTALLNASLVARIVRAIALKEHLPSGRAFVDRMTPFDKIK